MNNVYVNAHKNIKDTHIRYLVSYCSHFLTISTFYRNWQKVRKRMLLETILNLTGHQGWWLKQKKHKEVSYKHNIFSYSLLLHSQFKTCFPNNFDIMLFY